MQIFQHSKFGITRTAGLKVLKKGLNIQGLYLVKVCPFASFPKYSENSSSEKVLILLIGKLVK